jgi:hypothetical protein
VVGFDMSDQQFPPAWTLPKNLSLEVRSVLQPLPEKFAATFDIVHVRFLAGGLVGKEDYMKVISFLAGLLSKFALHLLIMEMLIQTVPFRARRIPSVARSTIARLAGN